MTSVLYITAHPLNGSESFSISAGETFIDAYRTVNPDCEIIHLDLYKADVPSLDADILRGWGKLEEGMELEQLPEIERTKIVQLDKLVDQFIQADKYVFVNPMWNFSYPPVMKAYIDAITVAGKTFSYTRNGPIGLLQNKKVLHIQASGWVYTEGPDVEDEVSHRHLKSIMRFIGITDLHALFIEGHDQYRDRRNEIKEEGIKRARELAATF
ncbi:FMN-dependent NADH-azoreductase [Paenibacillus nasutitermitis]|uniref:FMN dependent NADH:quinone oxidoreductase n=1 Tax=Paenibacillus nasutitermitis TaxID=1652958 RepID=A0A916YMQ4_9BACL|nr:FMN-dependent NADH-azoreductase [Paenibacillus nasutitermitis]GGD53038.1 FMN-dependent NADH-azoreductase 2 [Paenibacillus nasutitermitis]